MLKPDLANIAESFFHIRHQWHERIADEFYEKNIAPPRVKNSPWKFWILSASA